MLDEADELIGCVRIGIFRVLVCVIDGEMTVEVELSVSTLSAVSGVMSGC